MNISQVITNLIQFDKTEREVFVELRYRNKDGDVLKTERFPVSAVFSHKDSSAEIYIEMSEIQ